MRILSLSILLLASSYILAQESDLRKHSLRLGLNLAQFIPSELIGLGNYAEYSYSISDRIEIVPRIMSANANQRLGNEEIHLSQLGVSLSARITPFPSYRGLKSDLGILYQRMSSLSTRTSAIYGTTVPISDRSLTTREGFAGILGSLSFGILQGERLGAGLRSEIMTGFKKSGFTVELIQFGIFMSIDF